MLQGAADVVDGEVLFAQGDDSIAELFVELLLMDGFRRWAKEITVRILSELMDESAKGSRPISARRKAARVYLGLSF